MQMSEEVTIKIKILPYVKITLWQAIKLRLSGMFKKVENIEQIGNILRITYK